MPTSEQELTPLLRRIRRTIRAEGSYSVFAERVSVEEVVKAFAAGAGVDACELMREWAGTPSPVKKQPPKRRMPPMPTGDDEDEDAPPVLPDHDDDEDDDEDGAPSEDAVDDEDEDGDEPEDEDDEKKRKRSISYEFFEAE
jgi:hypothetical protein